MGALELTAAIIMLSAGMALNTTVLVFFAWRTLREYGLSGKLRRSAQKLALAPAHR